MGQRGGVGLKKKKKKKQNCVKEKKSDESTFIIEITDDLLDNANYLYLKYVKPVAADALVPMVQGHL